MKKYFILVYVLCLTLSMYASLSTDLSVDRYFCTAADKVFFDHLLNLTGSIHGSNFDDTREIAVFDLGFTNEQRQILSGIEKVQVYQVELTHPDLLKHFATLPKEKKMVRGWYAWKPVVIKQALDMFPYVVYLDAGNVVLKPLGDLFKYIQKNGYFLIQDPYRFCVGDHCTTHVKNKFKLNTSQYAWISKAPNIQASMQGLNKTMFQSYVLPMYELSKDLKNFEDDGSAPKGFGWGRHDQTLFGIHAYLLGLKLLEMHRLEADSSEKKICKVSSYFKRDWRDAHIVFHGYHRLKCRNKIKFRSS